MGNESGPWLARPLQYSNPAEPCKKNVFTVYNNISSVMRGCCCRCSITLLMRQRYKYINLVFCLKLSWTGFVSVPVGFLMLSFMHLWFEVGGPEPPLDLSYSFFVCVLFMVIGGRRRAPCSRHACKQRQPM